MTGPRKLPRSFNKVQLIENSAKVFNEPERQKLLIEAARRIPGPKLLMALDADEFLTANFRKSVQWAMVQRAVAGTVINFQWACVLPDRKSYYIFPAEFPLGFMDDGAEHEGLAIHSPRLPVPEGSPRISLREVKVMHFSTIDFERFKSKIRWYQCWEFSKHRWDGRLVKLYRFYHRDFCIPSHQVRPLPNEWIAGYGSSMHLLDVPKQDYYRWDEEMLRLFARHGTKRFRKIALWDEDWELRYRRIHGSSPPLNLSDPRSPIERWIHAWLQRTQPFYSHYPPPLSRVGRVYHRCLEELFGYLGW